MANTMTLISATTVGSGGASSIDFTSITNAYTDLILKISARVSGTAGVKDIAIQYNGDTATNYSYVEMVGTGSGLSGGSGSSVRHNTIAPPDSSTSNTFDNVEIYIPNYTSSNAKAASVDAVVENNSISTDIQLRLQAWKWSGTSAITSIKVFAPGQTILQYSTAYLYGIKNS